MHLGELPILLEEDEQQLLGRVRGQAVVSSQPLISDGLHGVITNGSATAASLQRWSKVGVGEGGEAGDLHLLLQQLLDIREDVR